MNNGLFGLGSIQTSSIGNNGILGNTTAYNSIPAPYGQSQGRGVGVNYDNLVFLIDTRVEADNIFSFSLGSIVDVFVDWGDGAREVFKTTGTKTHTYTSKGRYIVQIGGTLNSITFTSMTGRGKLISCLSFGNLSRFTSCTFNGCISLISVPNQIPRTFTTLGSMFQQCSNFNDGNICSWDTSNITSMGSTFSQSNFNRPLNSWNTSKVTNMSSMFGQSPFNQPIGSWDTSKVTNMSNMFNQQNINKAFNQNINQWNVGAVTNMSQMFYINKGMTQDLNSWDTTKVTNMNNMFYQSVFNGAISNWVVTAVQNIAGMFQQSPINQDLSSWNFRGLNAISNFDNFMYGVTSFSTVNYNSLLISMNTNKANCRTDLRPNFGSSTYYGSTSVAATARAALVTYGWTITDGGTTSTVPDAPTTVAGTAGNAQVALTWTAPTYNNGAAISDYTIQYSSNSGSSWTTFSHAASATASITVTGLTNSTAYIFRVAAVNSAGTGSYSTNSSSITPVAPSFTPVAFVITSGTSRSVPTGATSMKAWVIGGGGGGAKDTSGCGAEADGGYAGESVKTYSVTGGATISYVVGAFGIAGDNSGTQPTTGGNTTLTYGGITITGTGGGTYGFNATGSGGDFNRSFYAGGILDYQGRVAAVTLSGSSLNAGFKGTATSSTSTNGAAGGIVLYFT